MAPTRPTYPSVYIEEIPSGVRTIVGGSTSVAAFVDFFKRGPVNTSVRIFSMGDFDREFGGLDARSEASYAIQQFFSNGGAEAYVVRVATGATATDAQIAGEIPSANAAPNAPAPATPTPRPKGQNGGGSARLRRRALRTNWEGPGPSGIRKGSASQARR